MSRRFLGFLAVAVLLAAGGTAQAQFTKTVDFEGSWTDYVTEVMFRAPSVSGTTTGLDPAVANDSYWSPADGFTLVHSGSHAEAVFWGFQNPALHTNWVRLITLNADAYRNPALHLDGKFRVWIAVKAFTDGTYATPVTTGHLYLGAAVRETGLGAQMASDGGSAGAVEWVGIDKFTEILAGPNGICETTADADDPNDPNDGYDIQVIPVGTTGLPVDAVCVAPGPDGVMNSTAAGDDQLMTTPRGIYSIPSDGVYRMYEFDLPALELAGKVFTLSGDGVLGATPNNRGTFEHLALTNDPNNAAVDAQVWLVSIDDVTFESPVFDPPIILTDPAPLPLDTVVRVGGLNGDPTHPTNRVEVYRLNSDDTETLLGGLDTGGATQYDVPVAPLAANVKIIARQRTGTSWSDNSGALLVFPPGNGPLRIAMAIRETDPYDHALPCGGNGTGFDASQPSTLEFIGSRAQQGFGVPDPPRFALNPNWFEVVFNPCDPVFGVTIFSGQGRLDNGVGASADRQLNPPPNHTNGVWEGLYFRIDPDSPSVGPFTVYIDDMKVVDPVNGATICLIDDFESYTAAEYIVAGANNTCDTPADPNSDDVQVVFPGGTTFAGQIIVAPGADGVLQTAAVPDDYRSPLHARFNNPGNAGTSVGVAAAPDVSTITDEESYSGAQSLKIQWAFTDSSNLSSVLRLTTNGSTATSPPETMLAPDSVIPFSLDGTKLCDNGGDFVYSVMIKLAPPAIPADCDDDADVDLHDMACFQLCYHPGTPSAECEEFDIAPNGAPDNVINGQDFLLMAYLFVGPAM